ncbi:MAG: ATP-binding protein [Candidatus Gracilibacteria bacterium]|nr:ATP-binding protein [Candidatus Gracilibacteria bacterium]
MEEIFIDEISSISLSKDYLSRFYNDDIFELSFLFKSDFNNTKHIRDVLFVISGILGIDSTWKNRFVLIVDELNNNAIEYGTKKGGLNILRFKGKKQDGKIFINIEVEDEGNGTKSKKACDMEILRNQKTELGFNNHNSIRGRGLFLIITKLVDKLYFKDSQKGGLIVGIDKVLDYNETIQKK